jgi:hypothetical protein
MANNDSMNIFKHGTAFNVQDGPQTRTHAEAWKLHQIAAANFEHIFKKVRSMVTPSLAYVYLGYSSAPCAPPYVDLHVLFKNFNEIARVGYIAHPRLNMILNAIIFYYGLDKLYSFNNDLDQSRLNLFLAVLKWGWKLVGNIEPHFLDSEPLWGRYIAAWLESLLAGDNFRHREDFLETWRTSKYDLVWFTKSFKVTMAKVMQELGAGKPLVDSHADFLKKCAQDMISPAEFKRIGPSVAIHYIFEQHKKKQEREEKDRLAAETELGARPLYSKVC